MQLRQDMCLRQDLRRFNPSPISDISPLELEFLLDQSLQDIVNFHEENPNWRDEPPPEKRGNYFWQRTFLERCKSVKGKIPQDKHLDTPQILAEKRGEEYSLQYNPQVEKRIAEKLAQFKRVEESITPTNTLFSKQVTTNRAWIVEKQTTLATYLCYTQDSYLQTQNPFDLEPIFQQDVADHIGHSIGLVSKLVRNLTIQVPDGRVIFADELLPGAHRRLRIGTYAIGQLREDPALYEDGRWKVSDEKLIPILKERFGVEVARRTVSKYRRMLG